MGSIIFIIGISVGSFINSFVWRLKTGESVLWSRSYCPACKKILKWHDLVPILSFFILRGKCRYCEAKISIQYPLVEAITGFLFLFTALKIFNFSAKGGSPIGGQFSISNQFSIFNYSILSAALAAALFLSIVFVSGGRWMGLGDVKLVFFMGLVLGWPDILTALFLSFVSGAFVGIILILLKKKTMKSEIPFGTFLSASTIVVLLYGEKIVNLYWNLLL